MSRFMKLVTCVAVFGLVVVDAAGLAKASIESNYDLKYSSLFSDYTTYATVKLTVNADTGTANFIVAPSSFKIGSTEYNAKDLAIGAFAFNVFLPLHPDIPEVKEKGKTISPFIPANFSLSLTDGWKATYTKEMSTFGRFDVCYAGEGEPQNPLEFTLTTIPLTLVNTDREFLDSLTNDVTIGNDPLEIESHFAAHLRGSTLPETFFIAGDTPHSKGAPPSHAPEPATVIIWSLLFGGSWLGTRVMRQRRGPIGRQP